MAFFSLIFVFAGTLFNSGSTTPFESSSQMSGSEYCSGLGCPAGNTICAYYMVPGGSGSGLDLRACPGGEVTVTPIK